MFQSSLLKVVLAACLVSAKPTSSTGALYTMTNDPAGNSVIVNAIGPDGSIKYAGSVPTGGMGGHGAGGPPTQPDALFSQSSIKVSGNNLFVVNAGSNSVSMFYINPSNPSNIKMVGKPVNSGGEFPVSVNVSPKTGDVCVLNSGKVNGVQCFKVDPSHGIKPYDRLHSLGLNITTPPPQQGSASHLIFSADGSNLRASVKGFLPSTPGFVANWNVSCEGTLSSSFEKVVPATGDGLFPFGMANVVGASDAVVISDPALGLTVYDFSKPVTALIPLPISGQATTCWAEYSNATASYWLTDLGANKVFEASVDGQTLKPTLLSTIDLGNSSNPLDNAIGTVKGEQYLYVLLSGTSSFNVFSLKKGGSKLIQTYDFGTAAKDLTVVGVNLQGAATYAI